jgi:hypothetical protein
VPDAVAQVLTAVADTTVTMRELAWWWRDRLGVPAGDSVMRVRRERGRDDAATTPQAEGSGVHLSWYAEVDADNGQTITGAVEVYWYGEWTVESSVMAAGHDSFEVLMEFGADVVEDTDRLAGVVLDHARRLSAAKEAALEAFLGLPG